MGPNRYATLAALASLLLVTAAVAPGAVAGATAQDLTLEVTQDADTGEVLVSLTGNVSVANATVNVSTTEENATYTGTGTHETDTNGTLTLPEPNETVTIDVSATAENQTDSGEFEIVPRADSLALGVDQANGTVTVEVTQYGSAVQNATVNVSTTEENVSYAGSGTYETDENGTVSFEGPDLPVNVTIDATAGDLSASETLGLEGAKLAVALEQHADDTATVILTRGDTAIENATVVVTSDDEYNGTGTYQTGETGTVPLPAPEETVNVTVNATADGLTAEETFTLEADALELSVSQADDESVLIEVLFADEPAAGATVSVDGDYEYAGTRTTDENGTVEFPAPTNDTIVNVTATYENRTVTETGVELVARNDSNPNNDFAQALVAFIHHLQFGEVDGPPGQVISEFVHKHNPASADDHAGPPEHAGPKGDEVNDSENESDERGPPEWAGPGNETAENETDEPGPPDWAGPDNEAEEDGDDHPGNGNGPPDHAGPNDDADEDEEAGDTETDDADDESDTDDEDDEDEESDADADE